MNMTDIAIRRKQIRDCQRKRREYAKTAGLCTICCKVPADPGRVTCKNCRKIVYEARKK